MSYSGICKGGPMDGRKLACSADHRYFSERVSSPLPASVPDAQIAVESTVRIAGRYEWHHKLKHWDWKPS